MMFGFGRGKSRENVKRAERADDVWVWKRKEQSRERRKREEEERAEQRECEESGERESEEREIGGLKYIYFLYHCATVQF